MRPLFLPVYGAMQEPYRPRHLSLAALLSFVFPGLGQTYVGQPLLALLLATPVIVLIVGVVLATTLLEDAFRNHLFSSSFLTGLLVLDLALLAWRLFAIGHAGLGLTGLRQAGRTTVAAVILLSGLTVAMHAYAGVVIGSLNAALEQVFSGGLHQTPGGNGVGRDAEGDTPINQPEYRWDGTDRVNVLLLGTDAAPGRGQALTDTIMVVSVDPVTAEAVMISIPRDTGFLPLTDTRVYPDGLYPRKINELATEAQANPDLWCPDLAQSAECGVRTLERSVGLYLGIEIGYYAQVDLNGFARLIDAVGGVELCLSGDLADPSYAGPGESSRGIDLPRGCHRYDGAEALAYSRIRSGTLTLADGTVENQDDFKRAERQQRVILALRNELAGADTILGLPSLLDAIGRTVLTDFPRSAAGDLASLLPLIAGQDIERVVLGLPDFVDPPADASVNYLLIPRRDDVRRKAEELFGADGELKGWYVGSDAVGPPG
jgi:LCP family protein required for cell wall assembly